MIREWRISRFKSIEGTTALPFRPLTILAGANSSGKSTVIQTILLIAQSLSARAGDRQLVLNGEHVRLGTFDDIRSQPSDEPTVEFGFTVDLRPDRNDPSFSRSRDVDPGSFYRFAGVETPSLAVVGDLVFGAVGETETSPVHAQLLSGAFRIDSRGLQTSLFPENAASSDAPAVSIERRTDSQVEQLLGTISVPTTSEGTSSLRGELRYAIELSPAAKQLLRHRQPDSPLQDAPGDIIAARLQHFLPVSLLMRRHALQGIVNSSIRRIATLSSTLLAATLERWTTSSDVPRAALATAITESAQQSGETAVQYVRRLRVSRSEPEARRALLKRTEALAGQAWAEAMIAVEGPLPEDQAIAFPLLHTFFGGIRYLGPLRDDPKPLYAMSGSGDPFDVGAKGQFTAGVLDANVTAEIEFVPPGGSTPTKARFSDAILRWLQHFGMADAIRTSDEPKVGYRLSVRPTGIRSYVDLTNVGVGVSQVLPILVMALRSSPGSLLLFEQPELHLHPAVQSQLGDFFIAVTRSGRQCVVETHSEYLINRLRLRIAESDGDSDLHSLSVVHFVERPRAASQFTTVRINSFGAIPDWPRGFFDQSPNESEAILRAAMKKKNSTTAAGKGPRA